jgi:hypothetical protein
LLTFCGLVRLIPKVAFVFYIALAALIILIAGFVLIAFRTILAAAVVTTLP